MRSLVGISIVSVSKGPEDVAAAAGAVGEDINGTMSSS